MLKKKEEDVENETVCLQYKEDANKLTKSSRLM